MENAGRVGPRAPDTHQLPTTDRSLKRIRANEHEALLSSAQRSTARPCGYSDHQSLRSEVEPRRRFGVETSCLKASANNQPWITDGF